MDNSLAVAIVGGYTVVYVVVFFIQKAQINRMKEVNNSMKTYIEIFKIDEVKKYADLRDENAILEAKKLLSDAPKLKKLVGIGLDTIKDEAIQKIHNQNAELARFGLGVLMDMPEEERIKFIKSCFPKSEDNLMQFFQKGKFE